MLESLFERKRAISYYTIALQNSLSFSLSTAKLPNHFPYLLNPKHNPFCRVMTLPFLLISCAATAIYLASLFRCIQQGAYFLITLSIPSNPFLSTSILGPYDKRMK